MEKKKLATIKNSILWLAKDIERDPKPPDLKWGKRMVLEKLCKDFQKMGGEEKEIETAKRFL